MAKVGSVRYRTERLRSAMAWSMDRLCRVRENRHAVLRQVVGKWYSDHGSDEPVPINLLDILLTVLSAQLVVGTPRAMISTRHLDLKGLAADFQAVEDYLLEKDDFEDTVLLLVIDALVSIGVGKIGLVPGGPMAAIDGVTFDTGRPQIDRVGLDDFVADAHAKRWRMVGFIGNRYRMPVDEARNSSMFDERYAKKIEPTQVNDTDAVTESRREQSMLTGSQLYARETEIEDMVDIWDVYLPRTRQIISLADCSRVDVPLRVIDWDGPDNFLGPYHILQLGTPVPDELFPVAPVMSGRDLHDLANALFRKIGEQSVDAKTVLGVPTTGKKDGKAIQDAADRDIVALQDPKSIQEFHFNGPDQGLLALLLQLRPLFSYVTKGLDSIGGLGAQTDTVGQEQMLMTQSSGSVRQMARRLSKFCRDIYRDHAWWVYTDPVSRIEHSREVEGVEVPVIWDPANREADFLLFNFDVDPYFEVDTSPAARANKLLQLVTQVLIPLAPQLQQQGGDLDIQGLVRALGRLTGTTELDEVVIFGEPPRVPQRGPVQPPASPEPARMPAQTTRRYERISRPGATREGAEQVLSQLLLGGNPQQSEVNQLGRQG